MQTNQNQGKELSREVVFFDCEMSGSNSRFHQIIEIGAVRIDTESGELLGTFTKLVSFPFGSLYEREALTITRFDSKQWRKCASTLSNSLREFKEFSANAGLAAWGSTSDIEFLSVACQKTGVILDLESVFDLQTVAYRWGLRRRLSAAADTMLITTSRFHTATVDAAVTACLYCHLFGLNICQRLKDCLDTDFRANIVRETPSAARLSCRSKTSSRIRQPR